VALIDITSLADRDSIRSKSTQFNNMPSQDSCWVETMGRDTCAKI
jgi:hypothetical protein